MTPPTDAGRHRRPHPGLLSRIVGWFTCASATDPDPPAEPTDALAA